jgi:hypothetical protein
MEKRGEERRGEERRRGWGRDHDRFDSRNRACVGYYFRRYYIGLRTCIEP